MMETVLAKYTRWSIWTRYPVLFVLLAFGPETFLISNIAETRHLQGATWIAYLFPVVYLIPWAIYLRIRRSFSKALMDEKISSQLLGFANSRIDYLLLSTYGCMSLLVSSGLLR